MGTFYQILALVGAGLLVWYLYHTVKGQPQVFSGENIHKSLLTMGILAIILIVFVAFLVFIVRT